MQDPRRRGLAGDLILILFFPDTHSFPQESLARGALEKLKISRADDYFFYDEPNVAIEVKYKL